MNSEIFDWMNFLATVAMVGLAVAMIVQAVRLRRLMEDYMQRAREINELGNKLIAQHRRLVAALDILRRRGPSMAPEPMDPDSHPSPDRVQ